MKSKNIILLILLLSQTMMLSAYDSLVNNEPYFKKAIEKSKVNNFGENWIIAVLDSGINENFELRGKVVAEYDFTTNSSKAVDSDGHGTKMAGIIFYEGFLK